MADLHLHPQNSVSVILPFLYKLRIIALFSKSEALFLIQSEPLDILLLEIMERETRKRPSPTEEIEAAEAKRLCCDSDCESDRVLNEIAFEMDADDEDFSIQKIDEELVRCMIKSLEQEIMSSSSYEEESSTSNGSHKNAENGERGSVVVEDSVEITSCNVEFDYLWEDSDDELGIPTSPESNSVEVLNDDCYFGCDYNLDYGFFECVVMEGQAEQPLLLQNLWGFTEINDVSY